MTKDRESWIDRYVEYTKNLETPEHARWWTAATMVAALLRRQTYIEYAYRAMYPNLYTFIVGPSGEGKKSTIVEIGLDLVKDIDSLTLVQQKITAEALLVAMDKYDPRLVKQGRFVKDGSVLIFSPELKVFLGSPKNAGMLIALMTELFGSHDKFPYRTKGHGEFNLANICCTWIAGTTPDWLQFVPADAIDGGFFARVLIVHIPKRDKIVGWPEPDPHEIVMKDQLKRDAEIISKISGRYVIHPDARKRFTDWYEQEWSPKPPRDEKILPFHNRAHVYVLKMAMVLTADVTDTLSISPAVMERAIECITNLVPDVQAVLSNVGSAEFSGRDLMRIIKYLDEAGGQLPHSELLRKIRWRGVTPDILVGLIRQLEEMGIIEVNWTNPREYALIVSRDVANQILA